MKTKFSFVRKSRNAKLGPIPATMSTPETCPPSCPLRGAGCYAEVGRAGMVWRAIGKRIKALTLDELCEKISELPAGALWRHNVAGDLAGMREKIDFTALKKIVHANKGKKGFTYTHKKPEIGDNAEAIAYANQHGFTINLSADDLVEADKLADLGIAPVVVTLPSKAACGPRETPRAKLHARNSTRETPRAEWYLFRHTRGYTHASWAARCCMPKPNTRYYVFEMQALCHPNAGCYYWFYGSWRAGKIGRSAAYG